MKFPYFVENIERIWGWKEAQRQDDLRINILSIENSQTILHEWTNMEFGKFTMLEIKLWTKVECSGK
jgi:hypothetical protein